MFNLICLVIVGICIVLYLWFSVYLLKKRMIMAMIIYMLNGGIAIVNFIVAYIYLR